MVLTPDGHQWLLARAAWLAAEPDQAGWGDGGYARGPAELARLNEFLALAITTEELPPELRGVVELGDEVLVEVAADEVERFLLVDPVEAPLDDVRISVQSPLAQAVLGRRIGEQVEVDAPAGRYRTGPRTPPRRYPAPRLAPSTLAVLQRVEQGRSSSRSPPPLMSTVGVSDHRLGVVGCEELSQHDL